MGTRAAGYASLWCLHIQKEKRTTATRPMMGTREYSRVLKSWGFWENGLEVAVEEREDSGKLWT